MTLHHLLAMNTSTRYQTPHSSTDCSANKVVKLCDPLLSNIVMCAQKPVGRNYFVAIVGVAISFPLLAEPLQAGCTGYIRNMTCCINVHTSSGRYRLPQHPVKDYRTQSPEETTNVVLSVCDYDLLDTRHVYSSYMVLQNPASVRISTFPAWLLTDHCPVAVFAPTCRLQSLLMLA